MLQFITHPSTRYSIAEEVQMAIEGGCRWIQLRLKDADDTEFRQIAEEIIPLCKEAEAFLIFDDRVELTRQMQVHGVHLGKNDMPAGEARELLGPGAIIGVTAHTVEDILATRGIDIDYIGLGPFKPTTTKARHAEPLGLDGYRHIVDTVRAAGITTPIVAIGGITDSDVRPIMKTGVNGIAVSGAIINAASPVLETEKILSLLDTSKKNL